MVRGLQDTSINRSTLEMVRGLQDTSINKSTLEMVRGLQDTSINRSTFFGKHLSYYYTCHACSKQDKVIMPSVGIYTYICQHYSD